MPKRSRRAEELSKLGWLRAENQRGEDERIVLDGVDAVLQITAVPLDARSGADVSAGKLTRVTTREALARAIKDAINWQANRYAAADRKRMVPPLDIRHVGVLASEYVFAAFRAKYPRVADHNGFKEIWLIGPVPQRASASPNGSLRARLASPSRSVEKKPSRAGAFTRPRT